MILITRPLYDKTTHYLFYWSEQLVQEANRGRSSFVFDIIKKRVDKKTIESFLRKKMGIRLAIFNGHGDASSMTGHNNEIIISSENANLLNGKVVYMRACDSGRDLGPKLMRAGAKSFIGYKESFIFPYDIDKVSRPMEDEVARPCLECSNQVGLGLIRGMTAGEAHEASLEMFREKIDQLSVSKTPSYHIWFLQWNMLNQVCYE